MPSPSPESKPWRDRPAEVARARPLLGTLVQISAAGPRSRIDGAVHAAFAVVERIQRLMSAHDPDSDLSALNRCAAFAPVRVHADTYAVLSAALHFAHLSDGAFDPGVGTELERWGCLPLHGDPIASAGRGDADWRHVELLGDARVRFHRSMRLDLGGIAKGYAVDVAVKTLQHFDARDILVNAGGDIRACGERRRSIALRHPLHPQRSAHRVELLNGAIATSAAYYSRRRHADVEVSELVDPRSKSAYLATDSVTVRADDCMTADALTKVALFAPPADAERVLAACNAFAFVQAADGP